MTEQLRGLDLDRVTPWLVDHVPGVKGPITARLIAGGRSNLTFQLTDAAGRNLVLRRPPTGNVLATAHDMGREFRLISALHPTPVPVPAPLGLCTDESVNDADFYLMDFVEGVVVDGPIAAEKLDEPARREAGLDLARVAAALHAVDVDEVGLGDLAKREDYLGRQLRRWSKQYKSVESRSIPAVDEAFERLSAQAPPQRYTGIVHGDYRLGNTMFAPGAPARLSAVFDWELATIGDPLADLGYLAATYPEPGDEGPIFSLASVATRPGFPSRAELIARYEEASGRSMRDFRWYATLALWKSAIFLEGSYKRLLAGTTDDPFFAMLDRGVPELAERAWEVANGRL